MGPKSPPAPLLALSLLLGLLAVRELATPAPYRAAAPAPASGKGGELEDDDADDPFDFGDDDSPDRDADLSKWLPEVLDGNADDAADAADAAFAASGEGIETLGDLLDAHLSEDDYTDWGLSRMNARRLRTALDDVAGVKRRREAPAGGGGDSEATAGPRAAPVPPGKAAILAALKYVFYGGMILMWFGEKLFGAIGMPVPPWYHTLIANKTQVMVGLMVLNQAGPMLLGA
jgi:hypothetical protein